MTLKLNVHETVQAIRDANLSAAARIAIDELLQEVKPDEEFSLDLHQLMQRNRLIAHTWCIDGCAQQYAPIWTTTRSAICCFSR